MGVNSVNTNNVENKNNTARNTAIGAGVGLVGGGTVGYITKSLIKDNEFTDEFVLSTVKKMAEKSKDKESFNIVKKFLKFDENTPADKLKKFFAKNADTWKFGYNAEEINKMSEAQIKDVFKELKELVKDRLDLSRLSIDKVYDVKTKKFKDIDKEIKNDLGEGFDDLIKDISKEAKKLAENMKKTMRELKLKQAGIYGGIAAAGAGLIAWAVSANKSNKA